MEWTDLKFVRDVILFLATQGWQKLADEENEAGTESTPSYIEAIARLTSKFKVPLESAGAVVSTLVMNSVTYCSMQFSLSLSLVPVTR